jgi:TolA-binding protein
LIIALTVGALAAVSIPRPALADDAARISRLESDLQQLRARVDEQERRIERLENELGRRSNQPPIARPPVREEGGVAAAAATGPQPWHSPAAWDRVAKGMTQAQVAEILGPPTQVESVDAYKTLFYRGSVAGKGSLSGLVNLRDDQVVAVKKPAF